MGHKQFIALIENRNSKPKDWRVAIDGNPVTPEGALKVAILSAVVDPQDMDALDNLCFATVQLARKAEAMRQAMEMANDWLGSEMCMNWDLGSEPPWYQEFHQALSNAS